MAHYSNILADTPDYRPTILNASRRRNKTSKPWLGAPIRSKHYHLVRCIDGLVEWNDGDRSHSLKPGEWSIIEPQESQHPLRVSNGCKWHQVHFTVFPTKPRDPLSQSLWGCKLPSIIPQEKVSQFDQRLNNVLAIWWYGSWNKVRADTLFGLILLDLVDLFQNDSVQSGYESQLGNIKNTDLAKAHDIWKIQPRTPVFEVAKTCGYSLRQFRRKFIDSFGVSPQVFAQQELINKAKHMLKNDSSTPIKTISVHLGYQSASAFIRAFEKSVGMPPAKWRKQQK